MSLSIIDARRKEIDKIQEKIDEKIALVKTQEEHVQALLDLMRTVPVSSRVQMSHSASSSTKKHGRGETVAIEESVTRYESMVIRMRATIDQEQQEISKLNEEKRSLEM
ncbi:hypothetical protein AK830_g7929 [Neonectria ditissima]|uniref:Uncharacterized protein n=1 Tax=Neonectria ditissima TaxID=78410 RepID=A0A0P7BE37_9HYPO|nr:hypothetical protein AK830_g7929 [Neonectria ditissima]